MTDIDVVVYEDDPLFEYSRIIHWSHAPGLEVRILEVDTIRGSLQRFNQEHRIWLARRAAELVQPRKGE